VRSKKEEKVEETPKKTSLTAQWIEEYITDCDHIHDSFMRNVQLTSPSSSNTRLHNIEKSPSKSASRTVGIALPQRRQDNSDTAINTSCQTSSRQNEEELNNNSLIKQKNSPYDLFLDQLVEEREGTDPVLAGHVPSEEQNLSLEGQEEEEFLKIKIPISLVEESEKHNFGIIEVGCKSCQGVFHHEALIKTAGYTCTVLESYLMIHFYHHERINDSQQHYPVSNCLYCRPASKLGSQELKLQLVVAGHLLKKTSLQEKDLPYHKKSFCKLVRDLVIARRNQITLRQKQILDLLQKEEAKKEPTPSWTLRTPQRSFENSTGPNFLSLLGHLENTLNTVSHLSLSYQRGLELIKSREDKLLPEEIFKTLQRTQRDEGTLWKTLQRCTPIFIPIRSPKPYIYSVTREKVQDFHQSAKRQKQMKQARVPKIRKGKKANHQLSPQRTVTPPDIPQRQRSTSAGLTTGNHYPRPALLPTPAQLQRAWSANNPWNHPRAPPSRFMPWQAQGWNSGQNHRSHSFQPGRYGIRPNGYPSPFSYQGRQY
jgi:hypothetical protein